MRTLPGCRSQCQRQLTWLGLRSGCAMEEQQEHRQEREENRGLQYNSRCLFRELGTCARRCKPANERSPRWPAPGLVRFSFFPSPPLFPQPSLLVNICRGFSRRVAVQSTRCRVLLPVLRRSTRSTLREVLAVNHCPHRPPLSLLPRLHCDSRRRSYFLLHRNHLRTTAAAQAASAFLASTPPDSPRKTSLFLSSRPSNSRRRPKTTRSYRRSTTETVHTL